MTCLINKNGLGQARVMLEEAGEKPDRMSHVVCTARLSNTVHAELGVTQIQCASSQSCRQHRSNRASTAGIVAHNEQLEWDSFPTTLCSLASHFLEEYDTRGVGGVARVGVDLDNRPLVDLRPVVGLILARVVRMNGVGHVGRKKEGGRKGLLEGGRNILIASGSGGEDRQTADYGREHVRVGALGSSAADLLVIEQGNQANRWFIIQGRGICNRVDQANGSTEGAVEVVQTGREDELFLKATEAGLLSVEQDHLEVQDIDRLHTSLGSDKLHEVRVMALGNRLQRREFCARFRCLLGVFFSTIGVATSAIKLRSDKASNREELGFFVEREGLLAIKVDGQGGDAQN